MHTCDTLRADLLALGIVPGISLLMHSSYKSLGGIEGGAAAFYKTLLDVIGPEGNLIVPSMSFSTVTRENPYFDIRTTPSCVGYLTEFFRTEVPGVKRSFHPTHSCCAIGRDADWIVEGHELDFTPVGEHSPFRKLPELNGWILFLGCPWDRNTSMHGVEEVAKPPFFLDYDHPVKYTMTNWDGSTYIQPAALRHYFHREDIEHVQCYRRIVDLLEGEDEVRFGKILDADCALLYAPAVWKKGTEKMIAEPYYFVDVIQR